MEINRVEHKTDNLDRYLSAISQNMSEKTEILDYITRCRGGRYLEIGTGADSLPYILSHLPDDISVDLVGIDADSAVLDHALAKYPAIYDLASSKESTVSLVAMDATDMSPFEDESFDGINASSLVHEVFSYAGGYDGIRSFIAECSRVLRPGGVLVYRDPELRYPEVRASLEIHDSHVKAFTLLYLAGFTSGYVGGEADGIHPQSRPSELIDTENIQMTYHPSGGDQQITVTGIEAIASVRPKDVNFQEGFFLTAEHILLQDIMRHGLTLHQSSPFGNIAIEKTDQGSRVLYVSSQTAERFAAFAKQNNITLLEDGFLAQDEYERLMVAINDAFSFLYDRTLLSADFTDFRLLGDAISSCGIDPQSALSKGEDGSYSADTAVMGRLYKKLVTKGVLTDKSFINPTAGEFYRYLEQEGRERYFYLTPDEMIAFVASESVATLRDYAMVPDIASSKSNRSIAREKYDRYLQNTFTVRPIEPGVDKDMLTPRESKRIIHFVKLPASAALNSLGALVESDPDSYPAVRSFLDAADGY